MTRLPIIVFRCLRCDRDFESRQESPSRCSKCKSPYWDMVRTWGRLNR